MNDPLLLLNDEQLIKASDGSCCAIKIPDQSTDEPIARVPNEQMGHLAAWGYRKDLWRNGSVIRVRYINGSPAQRNLMTAAFREVDKMVGVSFKIVTAGPSECRVGFDLGAGHWSYVGTQNRSIPQNQKTMNIALTPSDGATEWVRVPYHEIFHLLGLNHEHQHPKNTIPWIVPRVYQLYMTTQGWSKQEIDYQVLRHPTAIGMVGTPTPDPESLMMYPIDATLVSDKSYAVGWNTKPSQLDLAILKSLYPF